MPSGHLRGVVRLAPAKGGREKAIVALRVLIEWTVRVGRGGGGAGVAGLFVDVGGDGCKLAVGCEKGGEVGMSVGAC